MPSIDVPAGTAHYVTGALDPAAAGAQGPVLVALHGAGASHRAFGHMAYSLGQAWPVIVPDLPGHGRSSPLPGEVTIPALAGWVEDFWTALCASWGRRPPLVLLGHSMGGAVAIEYGLTRQEGLLAPAGLVLVATGGRLRVRPDFLAALAEGRYPEELLEAVAGLGAAGTGAGPAGAGTGGGAAPAAAGAAEAFAARVVARPGGAGVDAPPEVTYRDLLACDAFDRLADLPRLRVPTLVIQGDRDLMTPLKYGQRLAEAIPGARLVVVEEAGHLVHAQRPGPVNRAVRAFLEELAAGLAPDGTQPGVSG
ncbi:MAG: alpha/beta hydrolase [Firmicutes bacterium]|nr:alpha/beta hydrolase [Bacillota bacterium]